MPMTTDEYDNYQRNIFYGPSWLTRDITIDQFEHSGYTLGEKINAMERVLHVDCDNNPFYGMISNLTGIDPYNPLADHAMTVEQFAYSYKADKFNVAFCLGALNFGSQAEIQAKLATIISTLRKRDGRIYFRFYTNPPSDSPGNFFVWTYDLVQYFAELFNFEIMAMAPDADNTIYAEWWSNNRSLSMT